MSRRIDLVMNGGFDYYLSSRWTGHDMSYSPDGADVSPRQEYA